MEHSSPPQAAPRSPDLPGTPGRPALRPWMLGLIAAGVICAPLLLRAPSGVAQAGPGGPATAPTVAVVPAKKGKAAADLSLPATLLPYQETPVYARTNGYVKRWLADIGDHVKAGQVLLEIDTPEVDRELKQDLAVLAQARANEHLARITAERWQQLIKDRAVSQQEVDERVSALEARVADVAAAQANVERLRELQRFQRVVAPFEGVVTARNIEVGQLVSAGTASAASFVFKVAKTQVLRMYVNVPQSSSRLVRPGMPADILFKEAAGKVFQGKVLRTAGALDPQSKTLQTEIQVPNDSGDLLAGMYVQVRFHLQLPDPLILLPANTLIVRADGPQVAAVQNGTVHMRKIALGRDFGQQIEILSGLNENEAVVTNPTDAMREGAQVIVAKPAAPEKAAAAPGAPAPAMAGMPPAAKPAGDAKPAPAAEAKPAGDKK